jgi:hypothetical protein
MSRTMPGFLKRGTYQQCIAQARHLRSYQRSRSSRNVSSVPSSLNAFWLLASEGESGIQDHLRLRRTRSLCTATRLYWYYRPLICLCLGKIKRCPSLAAKCWPVVFAKSASYAGISHQRYQPSQFRQLPQ